MILKNEDDRNNIKGYPDIKQYKYLIITLDNNMIINFHLGIIDKTLVEYFTRNYVKKYFSVKSIILYLIIFINIDFYIDFLLIIIN